MASTSLPFATVNAGATCNAPGNGCSTDGQGIGAGVGGCSANCCQGTGGLLPAPGEQSGDCGPMSYIGGAAWFTGPYVCEVDL